MSDEIDTSAETVERLADYLNTPGQGLVLYDAAATLRALVVERDAERERAEKAEAEKVVAHRQGYAQGKAAGDTFANGLGEYVKGIEAELGRLRELLELVPDALNRAFSAGTEEGEGGSVRRQGRDLKVVDRLRSNIRAALRQDEGGE